MFYEGFSENMKRELVTSEIGSVVTPNLVNHKLSKRLRS